MHFQLKTNKLTNSVMLNRKINTVFLFLVFYGVTLGQFRPMENYPSPQVGSLGLYGNIPVSLFTGQPNIFIPLFEAKEGDLTLPISLNYNLSNVKPNRRSGWVGLGWNLSAGGYISRNVRGCYDEVKNTDGVSIGFYDNHSKLQDISNSNNLTVHKENFLTGNNTYEMMSDEYSFNFGKYSGNFYLNEYGEWIVVSDDDIKVEFNSNTGFRDKANLRPEINTIYWSNSWNNNRFFDIFTLITPDGVRYTFGGRYATEYSISYYNRNLSPLIPTTWLLTKIESPKGFHIDLQYEADLPICEIQYSAFSSYTYMDLPDASDNIFSSEFLNIGDRSYTIDNTLGRNKLSGYLIFPVYLKNITTSLATVNLHSGLETVLETETNATENTETLFYWTQTDGANLFQNPITNQTNSPYAQFNALLSGNSALSKNTILSEKLRWRILRGISVVSKDESSAKTYYMEYSNNSRRKLTKIAERIGVYDPVITSVPYNWYDENGFENFGSVNRYSTPVASDYSSKEYKFSYNEQKTFPRYIFSSTDHWGYYNGYTSPGMPTEGERSLSEILLFDENFYSTKAPSYNLNVSQAETLKEIIYPTGGKIGFDYQQNRYSKIVPENPEGELLQENGNAGGVCISAIRNYDNNNALLQTKKYFYAEDIPSYSDYYLTSGILQAKKKYLQNYQFNNGYMSLCSEGGFLTTSANRNDSHISYSTVIEANYDALGNSNGYTRYRYTNYNTDFWGERHNDDKPVFSNVTGVSYYIPVSSRSVERGKLLSIEHFNSSSKPVKTIQYKYQKTESLPIKTLYQEAINIRYSSGTNDFSTSYVAHLAPIYTYRYLLQKEIEICFNTSGEIQQSKEKDYIYNSQKLIQSISTTNSNNVTWKSITKYPSDMSTGVYTTMVTNNILNQPIVETTLTNDKVISSKLTTYKTKGSIFVPEKVFLLETTSPLSSFTNFDGSTKDIHYSNTAETEFIDYDNRGNLVSVLSKNGTFTSYIWSYDYQYPIAEIKNATYAQVSSLLGVDLATIAASTTPDMSKVDGLRVTLPNAFVTSYTYKPLVGMTSKTDPRAVTTRYLYDSFGRLGLVKDNNMNITSQYRYAYQNMPETNITSGSNVPVTGSIIKNDNTYLNINTSATLSITGGSGNIVYNWYLKNSTGTVLQSSLNTGSTIFNFTSTITGILTLQCDVIDYLTNSTVTITKQISCGYGPITATIVTNGTSFTSNQQTGTGSITGTASITVNGGSGNFGYSWALYKNSSVIQRGSLSTFDFICPTAGGYIIECLITDYPGGTSYTTTKNITCEH